ncbi:glycosyltransferase family A protein [Streptomyces sp. NPDC048330]|uniref:glycosyltransferase family A protein n=1 Tax=Streptomyces sp. NPDC048330 TaxID=3365533 RepID=UPI00371BB7BD
MKHTGQPNGMGQNASPHAGDPTFRIVFLFHKDLGLLSQTLPRCLEALTRHTQESYEVVLHCDGTPPETVALLASRIDRWGVDELRVRRRDRFVPSGDASNNGHRRFFDLRSPYLIVIEDDVVMYRTDAAFDVLAACRHLFERQPQVPVLSKVSDYDQWAWKLEDKGDEIEPGVRSVNRLSTHFIAYDVRRFTPVADRFGGFDLDVFIDRNDLSYNWEDLVSHIGTTGGRRIAFPESWPIEIFHCDRKVEPGSMYHTQDPETKAHVLAELEQRFRPAGDEEVPA